MVRLLWWCPFALLAALVGLVPAPAAPAPVDTRPAVEVVFCLDTTGSMGALIASAKLKIWAICNQILTARPMPALKVGLLAFRDKGDEYITRVYDLRDDLDAVYADLRTFSANGGGDTPEHVNQALYDAVHKIGWSTDRRTLRIIFLVGDAAPHMDYSDDVKYPVTCQKAVEKGILINALQCGTDSDCAHHWRQIAAKAGGAYVAIPQAGGVRALSTPYDRRLGEINAELTRTTLVFGDAKKRAEDERKLALAAELPVEAAADRAGYLAKENRVAPYDLLDAIRAGRLKLDSLRVEQLPAAMRKLTTAERQAYLDKVGQARTKLLKEAFELDRQRTSFVGKEMVKNRTGFDGQVLEVLRKQAGRRFRF